MRGIAGKLFVSVEEASELLGLRREHLWAMIRRGEAPAAKFGRWYRVPTEWLQAKQAEALARIREADPR